MHTVLMAQAPYSSTQDMPDVVAPVFGGRVVMIARKMTSDLGAAMREVIKAKAMTIGWSGVRPPSCRERNSCVNRFNAREYIGLTRKTERGRVSERERRRTNEREGEGEGGRVCMSERERGRGQGRRRVQALQFSPKVNVKAPPGVVPCSV